MSSEQLLVEAIASTAKNSIVGGPFGSNLVSKDYVPNGVPVIRGQNMGNKWVGGEFVFVTEEKASSLAPNKARPGDLIFTQRGTLGQVAIVPDTPHLEYIISQSQMKLSVDPQKADVEYLYYLFLGPEQQEYIRNNAIQTGVPHTNLGILKKTPITLPTLVEQQKIAGLLGSLDDRIALLRETNATLEAIAQALFKSWFVDFDPIHARARGEQPAGLAPEVATLFSDSFEESALGMIPRGWKIVSVGDVAEVVKGKSYSSKDLVDSHDTALVTLKSFERGGGFRLDGFKPYSGAYKPSQVVVPGDLIIAYTDVTQAAELIGKPAIVVGVENHQTLVASLDVGIVRPVEDNVSRQFLYGLFRTEPFQSHTFAHTSGTTVLHLAKNGVGSFEFACPPVELVKAFTEIADSLAERRQTNIDQMRTLATLRDTLLPRLISGQLRLPDAEQQLKDLAV
ncbi:restriction endonuclease subunit S [Aeromonas veronii]